MKDIDLERLRNEYPVGCRIELVLMDDPQAPPVSTLGTVTRVDDIGNILVRWDNGGGLNAVYYNLKDSPPKQKIDPLNHLVVEIFNKNQ